MNDYAEPSLADAEREPSNRLPADCRRSISCSRPQIRPVGPKSFAFQQPDHYL